MKRPSNKPNAPQVVEVDRNKLEEVICRAEQVLGQEKSVACLAEATIRRETGRAELSPRYGDQLHAQALGRPDLVSAQSGRSAGQ